MLVGGVLAAAPAGFFIVCFWGDVTGRRGTNPDHQPDPDPDPDPNPAPDPMTTQDLIVPLRP